MTEDSRETMSLQEFMDGGYLQEVNREFFHPLGLAISVICEENDDGELEAVELGGIVDMRSDPEGMVFAEGEIDDDLVKKVDEEFAEKAENRMDKYGFIIQSPDDSI